MADDTDAKLERLDLLLHSLQGLLDLNQRRRVGHGIPAVVHVLLDFAELLREGLQLARKVANIVKRRLVLCCDCSELLLCRDVVLALSGAKQKMKGELDNGGAGVGKRA